MVPHARQPRARALGLLLRVYGPAAEAAAGTLEARARALEHAPVARERALVRARRRRMHSLPPGRGPGPRARARPAARAPGRGRHRRRRAPGLRPQWPGPLLPPPR